MTRLRALVSQWRRRLLLPVLVHLEEGFGDVVGRLDNLERRVERIERLIQETGARVATAREQSDGFAESEARIAGRVEEIERLLGARNSER